MDKNRSRELVEKTFESIFALEDVRQIWRDTAPLHQLSDEQYSELQRLLKLVKHNSDLILKRVENS